MYPNLLLDDYSRQERGADGSVPLLNSTTTEAREEATQAPSSSPSSKNNDPPLSLESEATRRARTARARAKQAQALEGPGNALWANVRTSRQDWSDKGRRGAHDLASPDYTAPEKASTSELRLAPFGTRSDQARSAIDAARTADRAGQPKDALRHYATAMDCGANDPETHFRMGVLLRKTKGSLRLSLVHLRKATLMQPKTVKYRRELAEVYDLLGFHANANKQRECVRQLEAGAKPPRSWRFW